MLTDTKISLQQKAVKYFDWTTFLLTAMLIAAGLISIYSATYESKLFNSFYKQLFSAGIGMAVLFTVMLLPERWLKIWSFVVYGCSVLLLVLVFFIGTETFGTKGWIHIAGFSLQPAEFAKIGVLMAIANLLSGKNADIRNITTLGTAVLIVLVPTLLIFLQPDVGSGAVIIVLFIGILFWAGFDAFTLYALVCLPVIALVSLIGNIYFYIAGGLFSLVSFFFRRRIHITIAAIILFIGVGYGAPLAYDHLKPYQKARIETFLNPGHDPQKTGYNVIQSLLAVGSGGFSGKGYLQGTQTQLRYIPMQWTDFIFSVPAEEFGFLGAALIILLYAAFLYRAINIAYESPSKFLSIASIGAAVLILFHTIVNIGMAIGIMPVTGIPLPFMSYGGSSLVVNCALAGLLLNSYKTKRTKREI